MLVLVEVKIALGLLILRPKNAIGRSELSHDRPHPPRLRMKRRNTVSVTPAMGAKTVAGSIGTFPIITRAGTVATARATPLASAFNGFSQYLRTCLFYCLPQAMQLWHICIT